MRSKRALALLFTHWLLGGCECDHVCDLQRVNCEERCNDEYDPVADPGGHSYCMATCASQREACANECVNQS